MALQKVMIRHLRIIIFCREKVSHTNFLAINPWHRDAQVFSANLLLMSADYCIFANVKDTIAKDMYDQIRGDALFTMLYGVVTAIAIIASCYLLFRRANAIAPDVTPPVHLRRWTAAFFASIALNHLWYMPLIAVGIIAVGTDTES